MEKLLLALIGPKAAPKKTNYDSVEVSYTNPEEILLEELKRKMGYVPDEELNDES